MAARYLFVTLKIVYVAKLSNSLRFGYAIDIAPEATFKADTWKS